MKVRVVAAVFALVAIALPETNAQLPPQNIVLSDPFVLVRSVSADAPTILSVRTSLTGIVSYQWWRSGQPIAGATNTSYVIANTKLSDAGGYSVSAYNFTSPFVSYGVVLTVHAAPFPDYVTPTATLPAGSPLKLQVYTFGAQPMSWQWLRNGAPIPGGAITNPGFIGEVLLTYEVASAQFADGGTYSLRLTNFYGTVTTAAIPVTILAPPSITVQPSAQSIEQGASATFVVNAIGSPPLAYQWSFNGTTIAGATTATLPLANAQLAQAGTYAVAVTNAYGSVTSLGAPLEVFRRAPSVTLQPVAATILPGRPATFSVAAAGTAPLVYQWFKSGAAIAGATGSTYSISSAQFTDAGSYTCLVSNALGNMLSASAALTVLSTSRLANVSLLTALGTPGASFTLGFVIGGSGERLPLLVRAAGPSLGPLGVTGPLDDPRLELFTGPTKIAENDNWGGTAALTTAFEAVGAFQFSGPTALDAATLADLAGTDYSARITAVGSATGTVLAELYDRTPSSTFTPSGRRLVNASVLKEVGGGFTVGFVIGGEGTRRVLIRAVGPGLIPLGVGGTTADPRLALYSGTAKIGDNDDWGGNAAIESASRQVGAFALPPPSKDAALIANLQPGAYSVQISSAASAPGVVIAEIYEVP